MKPLSKTYEAEYKVFVDEAGKPTGKVQFYASVFNNVDLVGDRVLPGAFEDSLKSWRESGDPIPVVFSHNWSDPFAIIGYADPYEVVEDSKGLLATAQLDIDTNPTALQAFKLMQRRIVKEASFSYDVEDEKRAKDGANNLRKLNLLEIGPCLKGANPLTDTVSAKSRDIKSIIQGSVEERQAALGYAAAEKFKGGESDTWVYVEATFSEKIVVCVMKGETGSVYFEVPYTVTPEGDIVLGPEKAVELETVDVPAESKAIPLEADTVETKGETEADGEKAGARNSRSDQEALQATHDQLVGLGAVCSVPDVQAKEPEGDSVEVTAEVKDDGALGAETVEEKSIDYVALAADFANLGDVEGEIEALTKAAEQRAKNASNQSGGSFDEKDFNEDDHPRDDHGRFGSGSGSGSTPSDGGAEVLRTVASDLRETSAPPNEVADGIQNVVDDHDLGHDVEVSEAIDLAQQGKYPDAADVLEGLADTVEKESKKSIKPEGDKAAEVVKPDEQGMECPQCGGSGKVSDGNGNDTDCPKCGGSGKVPKSEKKSDAASTDDEAEGKDEDRDTDKSDDPAEAKARVESDITAFEQLTL